MFEELYERRDATELYLVKLEYLFIDFLFAYRVYWTVESMFLTFFYTENVFKYFKAFNEILCFNVIIISVLFTLYRKENYYGWYACLLFL